MADFDPFAEVENAASGVKDLAAQWNSFLSDPNGRAALLSMGLQMMQPVGLGQTPGGHLAQSIGNAGESVRIGDKHIAAQRALDLKEQSQDDKLLIADERNRVREMGIEARSAQADARNTRAEAGLLNQQTRLGLAERSLNERQERFNRTFGEKTERSRRSEQERSMRDFERVALRDATVIHKQVNEIYPPPPPELVAKYKGKTPSQIATELASDPQYQQNFKKRRNVFGPPREIPDTNTDTVEEPTLDGGEGNNTVTPQTSAPTSGPQEGATATNPQTGQKVRFENGRWVYL